MGESILLLIEEKMLMDRRFGAVLEEFEVRDALESVFYTKTEPQW
jgi:hypothetical protein